MDGITGYVSIMGDPDDYIYLTKLGKLKYDLLCLKVAGFAGDGKSETRNGITQNRQWFIDDVKRQIINEERRLKLIKLKNE